MADALVDVLADGDIDDDSRDRLARMLRGMNRAAARLDALSRVCPPLAGMRRSHDPRICVREHMSDIASGPSGIRHLEMETLTHSALFDAAVLTIEEVRERVLDGSIAEVRGIGPKRADELRRALEAYDEEGPRP
jgi:hypothetical protein